MKRMVNMDPAHHKFYENGGSDNNGTPTENGGNEFLIFFHPACSSFAYIMNKGEYAASSKEVLAAIFIFDCICHFLQTNSSQVMETYV
jgi:hypothetical protein